MTTTIQFNFNDGGRAVAGFKGDTDDCVTRAIAIATGRPYREIYDLVNEAGKAERKSAKRNGKSSARTGVYKPTIRRIMESLGWEWTPTMKVGQGCRVHLRADELPKGRLVVSVSKHLVAVIDGVINDTHDCSRGGERCVYGYWREGRRVGTLKRDDSAKVNSDTLTNVVHQSGSDTAVETLAWEREWSEQRRLVCCRYTRVRKEIRRAIRVLEHAAVDANANALALHILKEAIGKGEAK